MSFIAVFPFVVFVCRRRKHVVILRGWPEMESSEIETLETVIASQINVGVFADVHLSEAIQSFLKKTGLLRRKGSSQ